MKWNTVMSWRTIKDDGQPSAKVTTMGKHRVMESSVELLVSDGESVWHENHGFDHETSLHKSITHYIRIDEIQLP